jgi:hypothetical protein
VQDNYLSAVLINFETIFYRYSCEHRYPWLNYPLFLNSLKTNILEYTYEYIFLYRFEPFAGDWNDEPRPIWKEENCQEESRGDGGFFLRKCSNRPRPKFLNSISKF